MKGRHFSFENEKIKKKKKKKKLYNERQALSHLKKKRIKKLYMFNTLHVQFMDQHFKWPR
jgi:hypothetical protein